MAEHDAFLRSLNAQVAEIMSGMETLAGVVERLGVKTQDWEDECTADGEQEPQNPNPRQSLTPDPNSFNPFEPAHPVKAELGAPPTFSVGEGISFCHCPYGDTMTTPGVDTKFPGLGDILRSHANPSTPK